MSYMRRNPYNFNLFLHLRNFPNIIDYDLLRTEIMGYDEEARITNVTDYYGGMWSHAFVELTNHSAAIRMKIHLRTHLKLSVVVISEYLMKALVLEENFRNYWNVLWDPTCICISNADSYIDRELVLERFSEFGDIIEIKDSEEGLDLHYGYFYEALAAAIVMNHLGASGFCVFMREDLKEQMMINSLENPTLNPQEYVSAEQLIGDYANTQDDLDGFDNASDLDGFDSDLDGFNYNNFAILLDAERSLL